MVLIILPYKKHYKKNKNILGAIWKQHYKILLFFSTNIFGLPNYKYSNDQGLCRYLPLTNQLK